MKAKNHHLRNKAAVRRAQQLYRKQMGLGLDNRPRRYGPRVKIYPSMAAAMADLPKCPKPKGGQSDHWWYIDSARLSENQNYIPCICGTCSQRMNLSADSDPEEWPAV